jgi:hypothetical protein
VYSQLHLSSIRLSTAMALDYHRVVVQIFLQLLLVGCILREIVVCMDYDYTCWLYLWRHLVVYTVYVRLWKISRLHFFMFGSHLYFHRCVTFAPHFLTCAYCTQCIRFQISNKFWSLIMSQFIIALPVHY